MKIHFERSNFLRSMVCLVGDFPDRLHLVSELCGGYGRGHEENAEPKNFTGICRLRL